MADTDFPIDNPISAWIWDAKYRFKSPDGEPIDQRAEDTWRRVANALAEPEQDRERWSNTFYEALEGFRFLPAGRLLAGAGTGRDVTLFNCFVMGTVPDTLEGIFQHLKEAALTMQQGGGIGYDFSTLRPQGAPVHGVGADASGPLSFMDVWNAMCRTIMSAGYRRGAMMATLRCDHPDIEDFIRAKQDADRLRMFNLSVLVTDDFVQAVQDDADWRLVFKDKVYKTLPARRLWDLIMRSTYEYAEPGVIFIDRINQLNNLYYTEQIAATNPCGEQPLPPYGACLLGSINLAQLVDGPFSKDAQMNTDALDRLTRVAIRMLDNAIDISRYPLAAQRDEAHAKRRIGLGVTGLADALIMIGQRYGSNHAAKTTALWLKTILRAAYLESADLAAEKGAFPEFDRKQYLAGTFIRALDRDVRHAIDQHGLRNALLTSIAPTGTISLLAGCVSSGIEPVFSFQHTRNILLPDGTRKSVDVVDHAYSVFQQVKGQNEPLPDYFVDAQSLSPDDHLAMQAAAQMYVDSSISKTINCPPDLTFEAFKDVYTRAFDLGCKGCTTYRPSDVRGAVLETQAARPVSAEVKAPADEDTDVVYMAQPLSRPDSLHGSTYKIRWPDSDHAIYITINDVMRDGRPRPFEVFINSKNMEHYAWTVALTRMISAVFRRGGDVAFVVEELKAVFDPRGGHWVSGHYVPSLLAAIGEVIERHMISIGFLPTGDRANTPQQLSAKAVGRQCPKCGSANFVRQENCDTCQSCGYSRCA